MAFKIRVQRTTRFPFGHARPMTGPFTNRWWEIHEVDPVTGKEEYYGFALSQDAAVCVVSDVLAKRRTRCLIDELMRNYATANAFSARLVYRLSDAPRVLVRRRRGDGEPQEVPC
ncbi:hypothetical protein ACMZ29_00540 [Brevibacterium casei]|uniref:Uncharacterized protein n=1 Tax=Brevibacterium casei TaxID=33889 RepID=A0A7T2TGK7_9MICO|nr:hypothetical protein [Brevibacterium casei]QPS33429.1 hypothetical protein I6G59_16085 [Brevibacterium casei]